MRRMGFYFAIVLTMTWNTCAFAQEPDVEKLIELDPAIQEQFKRTYHAFFERPGAGNCDAYAELQTLREQAKDKGEIIEQLAIFVVSTTSEEDSHILGALGILQSLDLPASIPIRVLAPYLDAKNEKLRDFARIWFFYHDSHARIHGRPPFGSVNYYDYMKYVRKRLERNEEIPAAFINFIYERHPGKALLVFAYASYIDFSPAHRHRQVRREIELSERIVSNAIWLKENDFGERFQIALPEAANELAKLAKRKEWWARLYVAWIMRQHPELRQADVVQQLSEDSDNLVNEAAKSADK